MSGGVLKFFVLRKAFGSNPANAGGKIKALTASLTCVRR